jgi:gliding motility-associated-like protein
VAINASPDLNATSDTAICPNDTATLRAGNAVSYIWSAAPQNPGAGLSCTACQNTNVYPGGPAVYLVTGTDANGCIGHDSTRVVIQYKTTASAGLGGAICLGDSFRLHAEGAQRYEWLPAATIDSPFIASPLASPRTTTTYIVAAQEGSCLIDSQRITVVVNAAPNFTAGTDQIISLGGATTLDAKGNFTKIHWLYNDTTLSCLDCPNPNAAPHYTRTYVATAENEWGCTTTDSVTVFVRCNGSMIFIPNTFTPNGDGKNDYFYAQGAGFDNMISFRIFNRWGELLFERRNVPINDERSGWDGSYKGQPLLPDTYIYSMTGRCPTGELMEFKGDVSIVR